MPELQLPGQGGQDGSRPLPSRPPGHRPFAAQCSRLLLSVPQRRHTGCAELPRCSRAIQEGSQPLATCGYLVKILQLEISRSIAIATFHVCAQGLVATTVGRQHGL